MQDRIDSTEDYNKDPQGVSLCVCVMCARVFINAHSGVPCVGDGMFLFLRMAPLQSSVPSATAAGGATLLHHLSHAIITQHTD